MVHAERKASVLCRHCGRKIELSAGEALSNPGQAEIMARCPWCQAEFSVAAGCLQWDESCATEMSRLG